MRVHEPNVVAGLLLAVMVWLDDDSLATTVVDDRVVRRSGLFHHSPILSKLWGISRSLLGVDAPIVGWSHERTSWD